MFYAKIMNFFLPSVLSPSSSRMHLRNYDKKDCLQLQTVFLSLFYRNNMEL